MKINLIYSKSLSGIVGGVGEAQWGIRGGSAKMNLFHKPQMSNKAWPLNFFLREVSFVV